MTNCETLLEMGKRLADTQACEQEAAEAYRRTPNATARQQWFDILHSAERLTLAYVDASMAIAAPQQEPDFGQPEFSR